MTAQSPDWGWRGAGEVAGARAGLGPHAWLLWSRHRGAPGNPSQSSHSNLTSFEREHDNGNSHNSKHIYCLLELDITMFKTPTYLIWFDLLFFGFFLELIIFEGVMPLSSFHSPIHLKA